jgi:hypothetical protein
VALAARRVEEAGVGLARAAHWTSLRCPASLSERCWVSQQNVRAVETLRPAASLMGAAQPNLVICVGCCFERPSSRG